MRFCSIFQSRRATLAALVLLSILSMSVALADDADPPGRVARLSYVNGSVSMQPGGVQDWANATVNRPLTTGDKLWADQSSRAELDIGSAAIRLGSTTGFSFLNLDDRTAQMNVTAGTVIVHVRDLGENQALEIDTPNVAVTLQSPGDYRVEVNDAGDSTIVKVSDGDAQVNATGQTVPLRTQQAFEFTGADQVIAEAISVGAPDELDSWSLDRDHRWEEAQARSSEYVSPDVAGADDLADYGTWQSTPEYGAVWIPTTVVAGWSPYHYGRWVWVAPWGWTWVDDAPWGFAPFHYGRWAYLGNRWGWVPGPRYVRPVYAPALVAWVGSPGSGVSISVGGGAGVGWFPLGPREVFVPGYHVSRDYVRNVNVTNTTIVNNTYITNVYENKVTNITYVNRNRPGAVVAVPRDVFTSAGPVSGHTMRIPENQLTRFDAHGAAPAIAPVRESVLGHVPDTNVRRPPTAVVNRPVVARMPPPPAPVPFERQQEAMRANGGRPLGRAEITALQPRASNPRVRVVAPGAARPIQNGQQFGTARPGSAARPGTESRAQPSWQDRERALHATPIPPSPQQSGFRNDRPVPNDRPPAAQMRQNDQYRPQNNDESRRQSQEMRPTPQARPIESVPPARAVEQPPRAIEQSRAYPQARPIEQPPRAIEQSRAYPQARPIEQPPRAIEQSRAYPQAHPIEQPRTEYRTVEPQGRPVEQSRPEFRAVEPPRQTQRPVEQPRMEARPIEQPRAAPPPPPQARPASPPPAHADERRANPSGRPDPRSNRQ